MEESEYTFAANPRNGLLGSYGSIMSGLGISVGSSNISPDSVCLTLILISISEIPSARESTAEEMVLEKVTKHIFRFFNIWVC